MTDKFKGIAFNGMGILSGFSLFKGREFIRVQRFHGGVDLHVYLRELVFTYGFFKQKFSNFLSEHGSKLLFSLLYLQLSEEV